MNPLVTVLIPVYNAEKYISVALHSILGQTYQNIDILVIEDGCTDGTERCVKKILDPRVSYVKIESGVGLIGVLNHGLRIAKGKYIARMDADDICEPDRIRIQVALMETHPELGACGTWFKNYPSGELVTRPVSLQQIRLHLIHDCPIAHPSAMLRAETLRRTGVQYREEYKHAEDYDLWAQLAGITGLQNISIPLINYRIHEAQASAGNVREQTAVLDRIRLDVIKKLGIGVTKEEESIHLSAIIQSRDLIFSRRQVIVWCRKLVQANKQMKYFLEEEFASYLSKSSEVYFSKQRKRKTSQCLHAIKSVVRLFFRIKKKVHNVD